MAMVGCMVCEQDGCRYCKFTGFVDNGDHLPTEERPLDGAVIAEWPEEPTEPLDCRPRGGKEAA